MSPFSKKAAVYDAIGELIERFDRHGFWQALVRLIKVDVPIDSWIVLVFSANPPQILDFADIATVVYWVRPIVKEYVATFYLVDPFYISNREKRKSGFFHLPDVAPAFFQQTDYYKKYFTEYVFEDEVHYNVQLDQDRALCLSIGSKSHFTVEDIEKLKALSPLISALMRQREFFEETARRLSERQSQFWPEKVNVFMTAMVPRLSVRQGAVIRLALDGFSNKKIAQEMKISVETVKAHRQIAYDKLEIKSQPALVALCLNYQAPGGGH